MRGQKSILIKIGQIIFVIILLIVIYQIARAILGGTWAKEDIIISALGITIAGMFTITGYLINQNKSLGVLLERTSNLGNSLNKLGKDFTEHLNKHHQKNLIIV